MNTTVDTEQRATELAGNWQSFPRFAWSDRPDDCERWAIYNTHHRDSGLLDQSNAAGIQAALDGFNPP